MDLNPEGLGFSQTTEKIWPWCRLEKNSLLEWGDKERKKAVEHATIDLPDSNLVTGI
jgi:hypothetical protein